MCNEDKIVYLYMKDGKVTEIEYGKLYDFIMSDLEKKELFFWSEIPAEQNETFRWDGKEWKYMGEVRDDSDWCTSCGGRNCIC